MGYVKKYELRHVLCKSFEYLYELLKIKQFLFSINKDLFFPLIYKDGSFETSKM